MSVSQQKLFNYEYKIAIICVISMFIYACESYPEIDGTFLINIHHI